MGAGLPAGVCDVLMGRREGCELSNSAMARSTSLASTPADPPVLLLVLRLALGSSESRRKSAGGVAASPLRLVVRLRDPEEAGGPEKTLERRGDERPSSFLNASAVPSSAAAATSMSISRPSGSRV